MLDEHLGGRRKVEGRRKRLLFLRVASIFTLLAFTSTNLAWASPLPIKNPVVEQVQKDIVINSVTIPEDFGMISDRFKAAANSPTVILIQDAHAVPDAQRSIQKIIQHFQKQYGVGLVALEGASSKLDLQVLQNFPDAEALKKTLESYFEEGELTGAVAAAILNDHKSLYQGIEDWDLYEEGLKYYLAAMQKDAEILKKLKVESLKVEEEKKRLYSKELLQIDWAYQSFQENHADIIELLQLLRKVKQPEHGTELAILLEESERELLDSAPIDKQVRKIAKALYVILRESNQRAGRPKDLGDPSLALRMTAKERQKILRMFNSKYQDFKTSRITPQAFALFLQELVKKNALPVHFPKQLSHLIKNQKRIKEIQGTQFFRDLEAYVDSVKEVLFQNDEERELDQESERLNLLERFVKLELTYENWQRIKSADHRPQTVDETNLLWTADHGLRTLLQAHLAFYQNAEKRDAALFQNLIKNMNKAAILVTGGFHTQGLTQKFKEAGISYLLLTPQIDSFPEESYYQDRMRGEVSWKKYFRVKDGKVNLYEAFVRGVRDELLAGSVERRADRKNLKSSPLSANRYTLKRWRDQIIHDLADKGQLATAGEYTSFLDEVTRKKNDGNALSALLEKTEQFIQGLHRLESQDQLTQQNIQKLLLPSTAQPAVLVPAIGSFLSSEILDGSEIELELPVAASETRVASMPALRDAVSDLIYEYYVQGPDEAVFIKNPVASTDGYDEPLTRHVQIEAALHQGVDNLAYLFGETTVIDAFNQDGKNDHENFMELLDGYYTFSGLAKTLENWIDVDFFNLEEIKKTIVADLRYVSEMFGSIASGASMKQIRKIYRDDYPEVFNMRVIGEQPYPEELNALASIVHARVAALRVANKKWDGHINQEMQRADVIRVLHWIDSAGQSSEATYNPGDTFPRIRRLLDSNPYDLIAGISLAIRKLHLERIHPDNLRAVHGNLIWVEERGDSLNRAVVFLNLIISKGTMDLSLLSDSLRSWDSDAQQLRREFEDLYDDHGLPRSETRLDSNEGLRTENRRLMTDDRSASRPSEGQGAPDAQSETREKVSAQRGAKSEEKTEKQSLAAKRSTLDAGLRSETRQVASPVVSDLMDKDAQSGWRNRAKKWVRRSVLRRHESKFNFEATHAEDYAANLTWWENRKLRRALFTDIMNAIRDYRESGLWREYLGKANHKVRNEFVDPRDELISDNNGEMGALEKNGFLNAEASPQFRELIEKYVLSQRVDGEGLAGVSDEEAEALMRDMVSKVLKRFLNGGHYDREVFEFAYEKETLRSWTVRQALRLGAVFGPNATEELIAMFLFPFVLALTITLFEMMGFSLFANMVKNFTSLNFLGLTIDISGAFVAVIITRFVFRKLVPYFSRLFEAGERRYYRTIFDNYVFQISPEKRLQRKRRFRGHFVVRLRAFFDEQSSFKKHEKRLWFGILKKTQKMLKKGAPERQLFARFSHAGVNLLKSKIKTSPYAVTLAMLNELEGHNKKMLDNMRRRWERNQRFYDRLWHYWPFKRGFKNRPFVMQSDIFLGMMSEVDELLQHDAYREEYAEKVAAPELAAAKTKRERDRIRRAKMIDFANSERTQYMGYYAERFPEKIMGSHYTPQRKRAFIMAYFYGGAYSRLKVIEDQIRKREKSLDEPYIKQLLGSVRTHLPRMLSHIRADASAFGLTEEEVDKIAEDVKIAPEIESQMPNVRSEAIVNVRAPKAPDAKLSAQAVEPSPVVLDLMGKDEQGGWRNRTKKWIRRSVLGRHEEKFNFEATRAEEYAANLTWRENRRLTRALFTDVMDGIRDYRESGLWREYLGKTNHKVRNEFLDPRDELISENNGAMGALEKNGFLNAEASPQFRELIEKYVLSQRVDGEGLTGVSDEEAEALMRDMVSKVLKRFLNGGHYDRKVFEFAYEKETLRSWTVRQALRLGAVFGPNATEELIAMFLFPFVLALTITLFQMMGFSLFANMVKNFTSLNFLGLTIDISGAFVAVIITRFVFRKLVPYFSRLFEAGERRYYRTIFDNYVFQIDPGKRQERRKRFRSHFLRLEGFFDEQQYYNDYEKWLWSGILQKTRRLLRKGAPERQLFARFSHAGINLLDSGLETTPYGVTLAILNELEGHNKKMLDKMRGRWERNQRIYDRLWHYWPFKRGFKNRPFMTKSDIFLVMMSQVDEFLQHDAYREEYANQVAAPELAAAKTQRERNGIRLRKMIDFANSERTQYMGFYADRFPEKILESHTTRQQKRAFIMAYFYGGAYSRLKVIEDQIRKGEKSLDEPYIKQLLESVRTHLPKMLETIRENADAFGLTEEEVDKIADDVKIAPEIESQMPKARSETRSGLPWKTVIKSFEGRNLGRTHSVVDPEWKVRIPPEETSVIVKDMQGGDVLKTPDCSNCVAMAFFAKGGRDQQLNAGVTTQHVLGREKGGVYIKGGEEAGQDTGFTFHARLRDEENPLIMIDLNDYDLPDKGKKQTEKITQHFRDYFSGKPFRLLFLRRPHKSFNATWTLSTDGLGLYYHNDRGQGTRGLLEVKGGFPMDNLELYFELNSEDGTHAIFDLDQLPQKRKRTAYVIPRYEAPPFHASGEPAQMEEFVGAMVQAVDATEPLAAGEWNTSELFDIEHLRGVMTRLLANTQDADKEFGISSGRERDEFLQHFSKLDLRIRFTEDTKEPPVRLDATTSQSELTLVYRLDIIRALQKMDNPFLAEIYFALGFQHFILGEYWRGHEFGRETFDQHLTRDGNFLETLLGEVDDEDPYVARDPRHAATRHFLVTIFERNPMLRGGNYLNHLADRLREVFIRDPQADPPVASSIVFEHAAGNQRVKRLVYGDIGLHYKFGRFIPEIGDYQYQIQNPNPLGKGGAGAIYRAWDRVNRKYVVVKVIRENRRAADRLQREVHMLRLASAEYSPTLEEWDGLTESEPKGWIVMSEAPGKPLTEIMKEPQFRYNFKLKYLFLKAFARALVSLVNQSGIVHGDLKPGNIMVDIDYKAEGDEMIKSLQIVDFGLAQRIGDSWDPEVVVGTLPYIAPEASGRYDEIQSQDLPKPAQDIFAFGVIAYYLLTDGRFPGDVRGDEDLNAFKVKKNHALGRFKRPSLLSKRGDPATYVPREMDEFVVRLLSPAFIGMSPELFADMIQQGVRLRRMRDVGEATLGVRDIDLLEFYGMSPAALQPFLNKASEFGSEGRKTMLMRPNDPLNVLVFLERVSHLAEEAPTFDPDALAQQPPPLERYPTQEYSRTIRPEDEGPDAQSETRDLSDEEISELAYKVGDLSRSAYRYAFAYVEAKKRNAEAGFIDKKYLDYDLQDFLNRLFDEEQMKYDKVRNALLRKLGELLGDEDVGEYLRYRLIWIFVTYSSSRLLTFKTIGDGTVVILNPKEPIYDIYRMLTQMPRVYGLMAFLHLLSPHVKGDAVVHQFLSEVADGTVLYEAYNGRPHGFSVPRPVQEFAKQILANARSETRFDLDQGPKTKDHRLMTRTPVKSYQSLATRPYALNPKTTAQKVIHVLASPDGVAQVPEDVPVAVENLLQSETRMTVAEFGEVLREEAIDYIAEHSEEEAASSSVDMTRSIAFVRSLQVWAEIMNQKIDGDIAVVMNYPASEEQSVQEALDQGFTSNQNDLHVILPQSLRNVSSARAQIHFISRQGKAPALKTVKNANWSPAVNGVASGDTEIWSPSHTFLDVLAEGDMDWLDPSLKGVAEKIILGNIAGLMASEVEDPELLNQPEVQVELLKAIFQGQVKQGAIDFSGKVRVNMNQFIAFIENEFAADVRFQKSA